jgi:hypothetical protein
MRSRVGVPGRVDPGAGVGGEANVGAPGAVSFLPAVGATPAVEPTGPRLVVGLGAGAHLAAAVAQALDALFGRGRQQRRLGAAIGAGRAGDLGGLGLRELAGPERLVRRRELVQRTRRLERPRRRAHRRPGRLGHEMCGAAMPVLAPHLGLVDPARTSRLDRGADPLASSGQLHQRGGVAPIEARRLQVARRRLQLGNRGADACEHGSPPGRSDSDRGKPQEEVPTAYRTSVRLSSPGA